MNYKQGVITKEKYMRIKNKLDTSYGLPSNKLRIS